MKVWVLDTEPEKQFSQGKIAMDLMLQNLWDSEDSQRLYTEYLLKNTEKWLSDENDMPRAKAFVQMTVHSMFVE